MHVSSHMFLVRRRDYETNKRNVVVVRSLNECRPSVLVRTSADDIHHLVRNRAYWKIDLHFRDRTCSIDTVFDTCDKQYQSQGEPTCVCGGDDILLFHSQVLSLSLVA